MRVADPYERPPQEQERRDRHRALVLDRLVPLLREAGELRCGDAAKRLGVTPLELARAVERFPRTVRSRAVSVASSARALSLHPDLTRTVIR